MVKFFMHVPLEFVSYASGVTIAGIESHLPTSMANILHGYDPPYSLCQMFTRINYILICQLSAYPFAHSRPCHR